MAHYAIMLIPSAHKKTINRLIAMIEGEDVLASENVSQPANTTGIPNYSDPTGHNGATHWFGGRPVDTAWLGIYQHLDSNLPTPPGGWPLMAGGSVALTEQEATDAVAALVINVTTAAEYTSQMAQDNLAATLGARGLVRVTFD